VDRDFAALPPITSDGRLHQSEYVLVSYVGTVENLLDRRYMETLGFPALQIACRTGTRFKF
jgi:hypothetical protein